MGMVQPLKDFIKLALIRANSRVARCWLPYHNYLVSTTELCLLCQYLDETHGVSGAILEVGCEMGKTTVFLNKHLNYIGDTRRYIVIDTFQGFTPGDIEFESESRGKHEVAQKPWFRGNRKTLFEEAMKLNAIKRVETVQSDINEYNIEDLPLISFCFIDVDLYRPVLSALEKVHRRMAPGGIIAVHDCGAPGGPFDGARAAYDEFVKEHEYPGMIRYRVGEVRPRLSTVGEIYGTRAAGSPKMLN